MAPNLRGMLAALLVLAVASPSIGFSGEKLQMSPKTSCAEADGVCANSEGLRGCLDSDGTDLFMDCADGLSCCFRKPMTKEDLIQTRSTCSAADGDYFGPSGRIQIGNRNTDYNNLEDCTWTITVDPGYVINLEWRYLDVEYSTDCVNDAVEIFDADTGSSLTGKLCGYDQPATVVSPGNSVTVVFTSDGTDTREGFIIKYDAVLPNFTPSTGVIGVGSNNRNYANHVNRQWTIDLQAGERVSLEWRVFSIEGPFPYCPWDSVRIYNANDGTAITDKLCGYDFPADLDLGVPVKIVFDTDGSVTRRGFRIRYKIY